MVTRWGMSEKLGTVELAPRENPYLAAQGSYGGEKLHSEETAKTIDAEPAPPWVTAKLPVGKGGRPAGLYPTDNRDEV
jgi:hypothetical protein